MTPFLWGMLLGAALVVAGVSFLVWIVVWDTQRISRTGSHNPVWPR